MGVIDQRPNRAMAEKQRRPHRPRPQRDVIRPRIRVLVDVRLRRDPPATDQYQPIPAIRRPQRTQASQR